MAYINGVDTSKPIAFLTASRLTGLMSGVLVDQKGYESIDGRPEVEVLYNTQKGLGFDVLEASYLKLREQIGGGNQGTSIADALISRLFFKPVLFLKGMSEIGLDPRPVLDIFAKKLLPNNTLTNRDLFISKLKPHAQANRKILILSHSGGTLYSNMIIEALRNEPSIEALKSNIFASMLFAPAVSQVPRNSKGTIIGNHLLFLFDAVVQGVTGLPSNMSFVTEVPAANYGDPLGHGILEIYLNPEIEAYVDGVDRTMDAHFKERVKSVVSGLVNNDVNCCNMKEGKLWINDSVCSGNQMTCLGGFIEKTVKLNLSSDDGLELSKDSAICGDVKIETNRSTVKIENSKLIGPATIRGDVELKNVKLDATGADINYARALIDGEEQYVKIDFTGSTFTQPNILGRPQISDSVEIKSNKSEAIITGSPTIKSRVKLNNSTIKEVRPPSPLSKSLASQVVLDGEFGEVVINESSLEGKVDVTGPVIMSDVTQVGTASIQMANLDKTKLTNDYYSISNRPGIQISKDPACNNPLNIYEAEIKTEADIRACGSIFDGAVIEGHVQVRGEVALSGKLLGDGYNSLFDPMKVLGSSDPDYGVVTESATEVYNRPTIQGDILLSGTTKISNNGTYTGVKQLVEPGVTYFSQLQSGNFSGSNNFSGFYYLGKGLVSSTVVGEHATFTNGEYLSTSLNSNATVLGSVTLKGPMSIDGTLGAGTFVEGKSFGANGGVLMAPTASFVGMGRKIEGAVNLGDYATIADSTINGSALDSSNQNAIMQIDSSVIENSNVSGVGTVTGGSYIHNNANVFGSGYFIESSTLNGGSFSGNSNLIDSTANTSNVSGSAIIFNSTLNTVTVTDSAYLCNKTYNGGSYAGTHNCETDEKIRKRATGTSDAWLGAIRRSNQTVREAQFKARRELQAKKQSVRGRIPAAMRRAI